MNQVQEATETLIAAIKESKEYNRYQRAKQELRGYPLLKQQADEFRKKNYDMQNSRMDIFEEADKLQREYACLLYTSDAADEL